MDHKQLWDNCLVEIETNVSKANFSTWFKNTSILKEEGGTIFVGVPNEFVKDWLSNKYHKLISKILMGFSQNIRGVEYAITKFESKKQGPDQENKLFINKELPLQDLYINKEDNLNPRYVFDSFIVGPFNELAHAASQAIIDKPGIHYNPFFVYGNTGLGKTHLIQAIGNSIKARHPEKKINYTTLEKFSIDYITSVQNNKPNSFKEKYRKYDVMIIDDIQFISKMEKTQEELFHLFNSLYESNKQIVFSSDKHPNYIAGLEDRLKSRFSAGMIIDIMEPEFESRMAILKAKCKEKNFSIPNELIEYIASSIQGNIRELEGSLNSIICQTQIKNRNLNLNEVKNLIKNNIKPKKNVSIKEIVKIIADFYNIEENNIYEKTRRREIVKARQIVMFILREDFNVSYPLIGQKLGGKDHTTVIHSCLKIKNYLKNDQLLNQELEQIRAMFK
ncbi:MAG: chromosomal replication initiator protein DnaA [Candidatus Paceibacterota bacterium]|jgi:chromosomal replication initiator protein